MQPINANSDSFGRCNSIEKAYPAIPDSFVARVSEGILNRPYSARALFDTYHRYDDNSISYDVHLDPLEMIRYFENNKEKYSLDYIINFNFGKNLILDYAASINLNIDKLLLSAVDNISNNHNVAHQDKLNSDVVAYLQDPYLFNWNDTSMIYLPNTEVDFSGNGGTKIENASGEGLNISSFGGVSKNIFIDQVDSQLNRNYLSLLTYDHSNDPNLDVEFVVDDYQFISYTQPPFFTFKNNDVTSVVIQGYHHNFYDDIIRLNITNKGLNDVKMNVKIQSLCKSILPPTSDGKLVLTCPTGDCSGTHPILILAKDNEYSSAYMWDDAWNTGRFDLRGINTYTASLSNKSKLLLCQSKIGAEGIVDFNPQFVPYP